MVASARRDVGTATPEAAGSTEPAAEESSKETEPFRKARGRYGLRSRKNSGPLETGIGADGLLVPTSVQTGVPLSELVFWRTKPGPLVQETTTFEPLRVMLSTG